MDYQTAFAVLTPYESRRLIAKAVAKLPAVATALKSGRIIIATGTSTGYVAEEILGEPLVKENFVSGHITAGETWGAPKNPDYIFPIVIKNGQRLFTKPEDILPEYTADDIFIKGANAVDADYRAAVFAGDDKGGTMGWSMGTLLARGSQIIVPVGLEKMIASVPEAAKHSGIKRFAYGDGMKFGLVPICRATVVTEIQAFALLFGIEAYHTGGGGIAGAEGSVVIILEGPAAKVAAAYEFVKGIKGEKPLARPNGTPVQ